MNKQISASVMCTKDMLNLEHDIKELENHFITSNKDEEVIKARRIMERVKYLTDELELIGENKRK